MSRLLYLIYVIVFAVLTSACINAHLNIFHYTSAEHYSGPPIRTIPIWIDKSFGDADRISINDAIDTWNFALNGYIKLVVIEDYYTLPTNPTQESKNSPGWLIMKVSEKNSPLEMPYGFTDKVGGSRIYLVRERFDNDVVFGLVLHEISHLLWAEHIGRTGLMSPGYTDINNECIDYPTIEQVAKHYHIPIKELNYCIKGIN